MDGEGKRVSYLDPLSLRPPDLCTFEQGQRARLRLFMKGQRNLSVIMVGVTGKVP